MTATADNAVADLQRANAELQRQLDQRTAERDEAIAQQTATTEVLQVINSSPGDLAPVFEAMLDKAMRLCEAAFGALWTYDGEYIHAVATRNVPSPMVEFLRQGPHRPASVVQRALVDGVPYDQIADLRLTDGYRAGEPIPRAGADLGGVRTLLGVALRKNEKLLGIFGVYRQEVRPFTDKQIVLLENFAAQAVIAMENARLITETREALEQQTATAEVLGVINSSPGDLGPVFDAILDKAHTLCGAAHGTLTVVEGEYRRAVATHGMPEAFAEVLRQPFQLGDYFEERLLSSDGIVHIPDITAREYSSDNPIHRAAVDLGGVRTLLAVPLRKDGVLLGYFTANRQEVRPFSDKQIALLQNFAAQAVIAMENARLLDELHARTDEIAGWNRELEARVATQLAEIERTGKLRRFLAPQLADLILAQGDESILESHRREIVVVFCDLRGFTAFAERAEPEEVMALLKDYHAAMGPIVARFEGTIDHYGGDGIMVFFNDPLPTPDPARRAIDMAVAMRAAAQELLRSWRRHGHDIGFGVGISQGYATLGQIGFAERMDYTAIGRVTNLAARLCGEAKDGQILVSRRVAIAVEDSATLEEIGDLSLKGLSQAIAVYNVVAASAQASAS
jgi:adenylate cyclase